MPNERPMTAVEAQELLYKFCQRLFKDKVEKLNKIKMNFSKKEDCKQVIITLSENLDMSIDNFPVDVQKYVYEVIVHALTLLTSLSIDEPDTPLPLVIHDSMSDSEKLSLLLKTGIVQMVDFFEQIHQ